MSGSTLTQHTRALQSVPLALPAHRRVTCPPPPPPPLSLLPADPFFRTHVLCELPQILPPDQETALELQIAPRLAGIRLAVLIPVPSTERKQTNKTYKQTNKRTKEQKNKQKNKQTNERTANVLVSGQSGRVMPFAFSKPTYKLPRGQRYSCYSHPNLFRVHYVRALHYCCCWWCWCWCCCRIIRFFKAPVRRPAFHPLHNGHFLKSPTQSPLSLSLSLSRSLLSLSPDQL